MGKTFYTLYTYIYLGVCRLHHIVHLWSSVFDGCLRWCWWTNKWEILNTWQFPQARWKYLSRDITTVPPCYFYHQFYFIGASISSQVPEESEPVHRATLDWGDITYTRPHDPILCLATLMYWVTLTSHCKCRVLVDSYTVYPEYQAMHSSKQYLCMHG